MEEYVPEIAEMEGAVMRLHVVVDEREDAVENPAEVERDAAERERETDPGVICRDGGNLGLSFGEQTPVKLRRFAHILI